MIARLRGILVERNVDSVVVECAGVGYDVAVSSTTLAALPPTGEEVVLRVYTHASENRVALYGFASPRERELFDLLITVKNVGPATALAILSGVPSPDALARMIAAGDLAGLVKIKGVGKKTAELLVVELKDKLVGWAQARPTRSPLLDDVASALLNLGWRPGEVDKAVTHLPVDPRATVETLLRDALRSMPR
ncbi:MAG TPA: Holliday junction branch migration protein RuvA [Haliangiales bacterium]|nr:Holliday junction branch migration protein RuvA [Haliangiales bacterium]